MKRKTWRRRSDASRPAGTRVAQSLDLSNLGLTRVPEEVTELGWLRELNLKNERWMAGRGGIGPGGARALSSLVNLTSLNLEMNWHRRRGRTVVVRPR